jgi:hypothetical protein
MVDWILWVSHVTFPLLELELGQKAPLRVRYDGEWRRNTAAFSTATYVVCKKAHR